MYWFVYMHGWIANENYHRAWYRLMQYHGNITIDHMFNRCLSLVMKHCGCVDRSASTNRERAMICFWVGVYCTWYVHTLHRCAWSMSAMICYKTYTRRKSPSWWKQGKAAVTTSLCGLLVLCRSTSLEQIVCNGKEMLFTTHPLICDLLCDSTGYTICGILCLVPHGHSILRYSKISRYLL